MEIVDSAEIIAAISECRVWFFSRDKFELIQ